MREPDKHLPTASNRDRSPAEPAEQKLVRRLREASNGLAPMLAEAEAVWRARAERPGWRPFEDAFPTFYQFTNRPR